MLKLKFSGFINMVFVAALVVIIVTPSLSFAQIRIKDTPESSLEILKHEWRSGGKGREAVLRSITIHNKGRKNYENISLEVDLYSNSDVPQGSINAVIRDSIAGGTTKTFENISFGFMNTDLEKTIFRVTGADQVMEGELLASDLITVKDWEWAGASYGTEGILKFITLENNSDKNYKDIVIMIESYNVGDTKPVPFRTVIRDLIPAKSVQTFNDINVGFRYSGAGSTIITVQDAKRVSAKELRYRMAKKGIEVDTAFQDTGEFEGDADFEDRKLTLAERYRKNVLNIDPESGKSPDTAMIEEKISRSADTQEVEVIEEDYTYLNEPQQYETRVDNALTEEEILREQAKLFPEVFKDIVIVSANADETGSTESPQEVYREEYVQEKYVQEKEVYASPQQGEKKNVFSRAVNWSKDLIGLSDEESEDDYYYIEEEVAVRPETQPTGRHPYTGVEKDVKGKQDNIEYIEDYELEGDEYQEPIPSIDIQVGSFKLDGAVTNTVASFNEITLINNSRITYTNIRLEATSYARTDRRPLASYKFTINEILPRRSKRTFRNVRLGFLSSEPEDMVIRVIDAININ